MTVRNMHLCCKVSQGTKYGDQNVHFFGVTPYIIFTHPVFLCLY